MTPIVHITDKEQALQRENERLTDQVKRQSATIHVQAVAIQSMQADAERYRFIREGAFSGQWLLSEVQGDWGDGMDKTIDKAMAARKK